MTIDEFSLMYAHSIFNRKEQWFVRHSSEKLKTNSEKKQSNKSLDSLQFDWRFIQSALQSTGKRLVIVIEGFDAAGKGGVIRTLTEFLDPRSYLVYPIGTPTVTEKNQHYLQRFWQSLPQKGMISIFDRSWYGRVLVEKVEKLAPLNRINQAYEEINQFESMLTADGIYLIKIFLAVSKQEQLERFQYRLNDPIKNWKITDDDLKNRSHWKQYVQAVDKMLRLTGSVNPWYVIPSDDKTWTRNHVLQLVCDELKNLKPEKQTEIEIKRAKALMKRLK